MMDASDLHRAPRGRPPYEPLVDDRRRVVVLVANGTPFKVIAEMLRISLPTLRKHFRSELARGHEEVKAAIGGALVRAALGGNVHAMKYWLMCRGGAAWRPVTEMEFGPPIEDAPRLTIVGVASPRYED